LGQSLALPVTAMHNRNLLTVLVLLVAGLSVLASSAGLLLAGGAGPAPFTTVHGQVVQLYGQGLYRGDTLFYAAAFKGLDIVTLVVFVPALLAALLVWRRGSWRASVALTGVLSIFLYNAASLAFSAAYNPFFLVYVSLLSATFFAFTLSFATLDHRALAAQIAPGLPRRGLAVFLSLAGLAPLVLWLGDIIGALAAHRVPELLGSYTTAYTYAVDLALVVPAVYLAAALLLRRSPFAYALAATLLILLASVGIGVVATTLLQSAAGIVFSPGQLIGLIGSWIILGALALAFLAVLLRAIPAGLGRPPAHTRARGPARRSASAPRPGP
jgi:hypothetical protein